MRRVLESRISYKMPMSQYLQQMESAKAMMADVERKIIAEAEAAGKKVTVLGDEIFIEDKL